MTLPSAWEQILKSAGKTIPSWWGASQTQTGQEPEIELPEQKPEEYYLEPPKPSAEPLPETPKPFMATAVTAKGETVYAPMPQEGAGTLTQLWEIGGFKNWARRTFANIFDPKFFLDKPTEEHAELLEKATTGFGKAIEKKLAWDEWAGKITGITSEEVGGAIAGLAVAGHAEKEEKGSATGGALAASVGIGKRLTQQAFWTGLGLFGAFDYVSRKMRAFSETVDEIADGSSVLPDQSAAMSYLPPLLALPTYLTEVGWDFMRIQTGKPVEGEEFGERFARNLRSSNSIYTMMSSETLKNEYIRRYRAGENPELLNQELTNPWLELAGSVVGDPLTYLGGGIPTNIGKVSTPIKFFNKEVRLFGAVQKVPWEMMRIPGLGELLGIGVGKARLRNEADRLFKFAQPELEKAAAKLLKTPTDESALRVFSEFAESGKKLFDKADYGVVSMSSTAKGNILARDVHNTIATIQLGTNNPQESLEYVSAMIKFVKGSDLERNAALSTLLHGKFGPMFFSDMGRKTALVLAKLDDMDVEKIIEKYGKNKSELFTALSTAVERVAHEVYPSVDEMEEAYKLVKAGKAAKIGRAAQLSKLYEGLEPYVRNTRKITRQIDKVWRPTVGAQSMVYMGWNPTYAVKNIMGQAPGIAIDMGLQDAIEISLKAGFEIPEKFVEMAFVQNENRMKKMLGGALPEGMRRGLGSGGTKGKAIMKIAANQEKLTASEIILRTVDREITGALKHGAIPDVTALIEAGMPKAQADILFKLVLDNYGDSKSVLSEFNRLNKTGELEIWRHLPLDDTLSVHLSHIGKLDEVRDIQKTALTQDEFAERMGQILTRYDEEIAKGADEIANIGFNVPEELRPIVAEAQDLATTQKVIPAYEADIFTRKVQAGANMRDAADEAVKMMYGKLSRLIHPERTDFYGKTWAGFTKEYRQQYGVVTYLRNVVLHVYERSKKGGDIATLWKDARLTRLGESYWSLVDIYPAVKDPTLLSRGEFHEMLWSAFYDKAGTIWRDANLGSVDSELGMLQDMAKEAGVKLEDIAKPAQGQIDLVANVQKLRKEYTDIEEMIGMKGRDFMKLGKDVPPGTTLAQMDLRGTGFSKNRLFDSVNKDRRLAGLTEATTTEEILFQEARASLMSRTGKQLPPYVPGTNPSGPRQLFENKEGFTQAFNAHVDNVVTRWGEKMPVPAEMPDEVRVVMDRWVKELDKRMITVKGKAIVYSTALRDFILHDYNKTYLDLAAGYLMPYHFWHDRTYMRYMERAIENPSIVAAYAKYKQFLAREHAGLPEWWKYNIPITFLPGTDSEHPLFFNLEASLNPLNGMTGVDFEDSYKRVDWLSKTVDDMNKFGPTTLTPISWVVAYNLWKKGEDEAATRWMGRLFPQTASIKAALNVTGIKLPTTPVSKYNELDPFVNYFSNGLDPYERARVGRAAAAMEMEGAVVDGQQVTQEMVLDATNYQSGSLWDAAVDRAVGERAPGQLFSFFTGVGFKPRTQSDMTIDKFYADFYRLVQSDGNLNPLDYRDQWDKLRDKYPFMDAVLLSKKGGDDRNIAYAYNVLSRIPPGQTDDILELVGIDNKIVNKFYEGKGDTSKWSTGDKKRWEGAMADVGAILRLPDYATKSEWNVAKTMYQQANDAVSKVLGEDIWTKVDNYFIENDKGRSASEAYLEANPDVQQAFAMKEQFVLNNPLLAEYYGSLETIDRYYTSLMYQTIESKLGEDIFDKWNEYYELRLVDPKQATAYYKAHPELAKYSDYKKQLKQQVNRAVVAMADKVPEKENLPLRRDIEPRTQAALAQAIQPRQLPSWEEWQQVLSEPMQRLIQDYFVGGTELPYAVMDQLDYMYKELGFYDADEMLQAIGISLQK